jgi:uncharacterized protein (DUF433 family)
MHGLPVFRETRVPVQTLFDYLEGGDTLGEFLEGFPTVPRELALAALEEAKQLPERYSSGLSFALEDLLVVVVDVCVAMPRWDGSKSGR